ncbi:unnamed protein product [Rotaria socialis]
MNNLMYLRDACSEAANANMHKGLKKLITTWLHMRDAYNISSKDCVRVLHPVKITDQFFDSIFSGDIVYYSTAYIGQVRFTTVQHAREKVSDDAAILFKDGLKENFGRIRRIFTVNSGEPILYVDVISKMLHFECATSSDVYSYSYIQTGLLDEQKNSIFISATNIVEKTQFLRNHP